MEARLGVITCDKCGQPMLKGQNVLVIADGLISNSNDELDFKGTDIRFACHSSCWDGVEEEQ